MEKREDYSKRKRRGSRRVGVNSGKTGRLLQEEEKRKQAGWSKKWKNGKIAPRGRKEEASVLGERVERREDCSKRKKKGSKWIGVKREKTRRLLQEEEKRKQAGFGKQCKI